MFALLRRSTCLSKPTSGTTASAKILGLFNHTRNFQNAPFNDDLTPANESLFNLEDFQHYKEAPDVKSYRKELGLVAPDDDFPQPLPFEKRTTEYEGLRSKRSSINEQEPIPSQSSSVSFEQLCAHEKPVVFISKLSDPYLNLAIEDYIYDRMPLPKSADNCNRLMFYVNSACVVIGKNQNPWKEVNIPLLSDLKIPLVRRRSGGGTVVHDAGNVNYSFMTTKEKFDRFTFAQLVVKAVNSLESLKHPITVNERGDIVTKEDTKKVSGSAYKLSKGKSYHHGTMLLNSKLDILRKLLHRDEAQLGEIVSSAAVKSVKSPVTNLLIEKEEFIGVVTTQFQQIYGVPSDNSIEPAEDTETNTDYDQTDLLGLQSFVDAYSERVCDICTIDNSTVLPQEIVKVRDELKEWEWQFGATPRFQHRLYNAELDVHVSIEVDKKALVTAVHLETVSDDVKDAFEFLQSVIERGDEVKYTGSSLAGFVTDDKLSEWLGSAIDGTT